MIITGIWGLTLASEPAEMIIFIMFIILGLSLLIYTIYTYRKKKDVSDHIFDCFNCVDCGGTNFPDKKGMDCDCTPDCIN